MTPETMVSFRRARNVNKNIAARHLCQSSPDKLNAQRPNSAGGKNDRAAFKFTDDIAAESAPLQWVVRQPVRRNHATPMMLFAPAYHATLLPFDGAAAERIVGSLKGVL